MKTVCRKCVIMYHARAWKRMLRRQQLPNRPDGTFCHVIRCARRIGIRQRIQLGRPGAVDFAHWHTTIIYAVQ
jgi:hypothetical protein